MKWPILLEKLPVRINAMRWTGDNYSDLKAWGAPVSFLGGGEKLWLWVQANTAQLPIDLGEWIAKDDLGFYPIKHDDNTNLPRCYREVTDAELHAAGDR